MKRLKSIFLVLVIMLLSLGLASNTYARERAGENDCEHSSRRSRGGRDNSGGRLDYDGRTSGLGRELGGIVGGAAGGSKGGLAGGYIGGKIGSRAGDAWERRANRGAHDKWNNKGRKDRGYGGGWRFSDEID
ncbi:hypothetical protein KST01_09980 [Fusobacterium animalis]|uniref:hypothetical protein n=1 Tax=Fusobacterium TaxID=848 RepID=UPI0002137B38|nr:MULTISPECIES: hypothetical protein [Fusobacterium]EGN64149.1 hypothetical protein HMPREF0404_00024 [Fusobacterium animalis 21_1A]OFQ56531.1 hypothetical protein HMPREF2931_00890 [Fusobacterium sp. HMSC065F01]